MPQFLLLDFNNEICAILANIGEVGEEGKHFLGRKVCKPFSSSGKENVQYFRCAGSTEKNAFILHHILIKLSLENYHHMIYMSDD